METRTVSSEKMTLEIIGRSFIMGSAILLFYRFFYSYIFNSLQIDSNVIKSIVSIILEGILVFTILRFGIFFANQSYTIEKKDVDNVIRNLIIITGILCFIMCIFYLFKIENELNKNATVDNMMERFDERYNVKLSVSQRKELEKSTQEVLDKKKKEFYIQFMCFRSIELIVIIMTVLLQKGTLRNLAV